MIETTCFDVFEQCVLAVQSGELITSLSAKDKEFHFQNWFRGRLESLDVHFQESGRNTYPDFSMVEHSEGYEVKGLAWPGRERDYDSNSQIPTDALMVGYSFDLRSNELKAEWIPNPNAGIKHRFVAYRLKGQASKPISMTARAPGPGKKSGVSKK